MSKQSELAARAARLSTRPARPDTTTTAPDEAPTATRAAPPRARPVRVTADLAPQSYRALVAYCATLAEEIGQARVPHVEVLRALVAQLDTDNDLQAVIAQRVRTQLSK